MRGLVIVLVSLLAASPAAQSPAAPSLEAVLERLGAYVASYGEKTALVVSIEKYTQTVALEGTDNMPKRANWSRSSPSSRPVTAPGSASAMSSKWTAGRSAIGATASSR